jgi:nondiscriminating glutamyl-tRNA synthetase
MDSVSIPKIHIFCHFRFIKIIQKPDISDISCQSASYNYNSPIMTDSIAHPHPKRPKARFCPSPTGLMHLGNTRTALFNFLLAKNISGTFLLRIEDTDKARSDPKLTRALIEDLKWLGLHWHEGAEVGGEHGPYLQSERPAIYEEFYGMLQKKNLVYPCFCSEEQLALTRKIQASMGKPPRYDGRCRNLSEQEIIQKLEQGLKPTLRFKIPEHEKITFTDLIKGEQCINSDDIGDFIIRRTDGSAPFMFCNAIDDALMGVTHALRGEDHLTNTPRQLLILRALGLHEPRYGHMSLIVGHDGAPLSKRHGSRNVQELRAAGFLPEAINNYLARLGHPYATDDLLRLDQLAASFSCDALSHSPAKFDEHQLLHWQKKAVAALEHNAFCAWFDDAAQNLVPAAKLERFAQAVQPNVAFPHEAETWAKIFFSPNESMNEQRLPISDEARQAINATKAATPSFYQVAIEFLSQPTPTSASVAALATPTHEPLCNELKSKLGVKGKALFMPLRAALTGRLDGPDFASIFYLLGLPEIKARLHHANIATTNN